MKNMTEACIEFEVGDLVEIRGEILYSKRRIRGLVIIIDSYTDSSLWDYWAYSIELEEFFGLLKLELKFLD